MIHYPQALNIQRAAALANDDEHLDKYGDSKAFDQPHAYLKDSEISENDIYTQEFFLHIYSLFS